MIYLLALSFGIVAGLRAMTVPAAVSWAAYLGLLPLRGSWLGFLASPITAVSFSLLALGELVTDQLPSTPSRTVPVQFATRILMGALAGTATAMDGGNALMGALAGVVGAVIGTLGGRALRARLAARLGRDRPGALLEDAVAIAGALLLVVALP